MTNMLAGHSPGARDGRDRRAARRRAGRALHAGGAPGARPHLAPCCCSTATSCATAPGRRCRRRTAAPSTALRSARPWAPAAPPPSPPAGRRARHRADPRWAAYRDVALRHGLAACWSIPILTPDGECLGTFAMYYREQRSPATREWRLLETASQHRARRHHADANRGCARRLAAAARRRRARSQARWCSAGRGLISSLDKPDVVERLCRLATELLGLDASVALLRDPATTPTCRSSCTATRPPLDRAARSAVPGGRDRPSAGTRRRRRRSLALLPDDAAPAGEAALRHDLGPGACLLIPLRHGGECARAPRRRAAGPGRRLHAGARADRRRHRPARVRWRWRTHA